MKLFELCGINNNHLSVDIVPLFETIEALQIAHEIMKKLWSYEKYQLHLKNRGNKQYVMLGFSSATKDGGYFKANWQIYTVKLQLSELASNNGIEIIFFLMAEADLQQEAAEKHNNSMPRKAQKLNSIN